ncbi:MAG: recombinase RecJ [Oscillospiraceae bacterium]|jgi:phosphoesterase RecJ-like protein|nr:recombinase RecJ [Oscillospiraceae bacterium]
MKLSALLNFEQIVIQCHDNPDADAIASGFGVFCYLKAHGKEARLIYGGSPIGKSNLKRMVERLEIPIEYIEELKEKPPLLLTVDCQPGERNVKPFPAEQFAAIDHHTLRRDGLSGLWEQEVRDNYGACATIVWDMLRDEGFDVSKDPVLATALYYGLFMDTCKLQEIYHLTDRAMRDALELQCIDSALNEFKMYNLSTEELRIVGQALAGCDYREPCRYAVAEVEPCDPNLLGLISDQMIEADMVDCCIAYCMLPGGAKLSIRSCTAETRASDLAAYLCGGGGHERKAGGFLPIEILKYHAIDPRELGSSVHRFLTARMEDYFAEQDIIRAESCRIDLSADPLYRKKPVPVGYIRAADVYPPHTKLKVRMLEGDRLETVSNDLYLMVGVRQEVYVNDKARLLANNSLSDAPLPLAAKELRAVEDAVSAVNEEHRPLAGHIFACTPKGAQVRARLLTRRTKVFQLGREEYMLGEPGDYLVARENNLSDIYIIRGDVFALTYEPEKGEGYGADL